MKRNIYSGKFIAIEGLDGSGQTTQTSLLRDYLMIKKSLGVVLTKEPTLDSDAGKEIDRILKKEKTVSPKEFQELFAKDRAEHLNSTIIPNLKMGKIVISDRYFLSSLAYGATDGVGLDYLRSLNEKFLEPDLTILLRVSPKVCMERIKKRGEKETIFEQEQKLTKVWEVYEKLAKGSQGIIIVDGERSMEKITEDIKTIINQQLMVA